MKGSSLLNSIGKGASDLREALPSIGKGSSILNPGSDGLRDLREALPKVEASVQSGDIPDTKIPHRFDLWPKEGADNASSAATP